MQSNFDRSLSAVLKHEGGFVNNPKDNGGPTNRGVTLANFRRFVKPNGTIADLKALTAAQAGVVFLRQYWDTVLGSQLPVGVDYCVFDMSIHSGPKLASKYLQRSLGMAYTGKVDGVIGPKTLTAVVSLVPADIINAMIAGRSAFLQRHEDWPTFGKGWTARLKGVRKLALEMATAHAAEPVPQPVAVPDEPTQPETKTPATDAPTGLLAWLIQLIVNLLKGFRKEG